MRASLKQSLKDTPASGFERYPKGSIVLCNACTRPIYKLEAGIALGDKGGKSATCFKPLTTVDLIALAHRQDVDGGVQAAIRALQPEQERRLTDAACPKAGDPMLCPVCQECFVQVLSVERSEVLDKAYVIELLTIPPEGHKPVAVRGKQIGAHKAWIHEGAEVIH